MPIPQLPLELVEYILDFMDVAIEDRREFGETVSLVCRQWQPIGRHIAWSSVTVGTEEDSRFVRDLLKRPQLVKEIRELVLVPFGRSYTFSSIRGLAASIATAIGDIFRQQSVTCIDLIEACAPHLQHIALKNFDLGLAPIDLPRLLHFVASSTITSLTLAAEIRYDFTLSDLVTSLVRFQRLERLHLFLRWADEHSSLEPPTLATRNLPIKQLTCNLMPMDPRKVAHVYAALDAVIDATRVTSIGLHGCVAAADTLGWLSRYTALRTLTISAPSPAALSTFFPHIVTALVTFANLSDVRISAPKEEPIVSPIPLNQFVAFLPLKLRCAIVEGLYFFDNIGLVDMAGKNSKKRPAHVLGVKIAVLVGQDLDVVPRMLLCCKEADGTEVWCLNPSFEELYAAIDARGGVVD